MSKTTFSFIMDKDEQRDIFILLWLKNEEGYSAKKLCMDESVTTKRGPILQS